jgi:magnesium transporter
MLPADAASGLLARIPDFQAADLVEEMAVPEAAAALQALPRAEQADILSDLARSDAEAILSAMEPEQAQEARALAVYPPDQAGGLMETEFLSYPKSCTAGDVIDDLRDHAETYRDYQVQYGFVTDEAGVLVGVLRLRDLLLSRRTTPLRELMIERPHHVLDTAGLEELEGFFDRHPFFGVPVVDAAGRLLGIVRRAGVEEARAERTGRDYLQSLGIVGGEEIRSMPLLLRARRRLSWLSINVVLNLVAASVITLYQDTLAAVIALAVFLPIISDMSGCSGNQAVAVSIRELTLGLVRPHELLRVWVREISVGALNGLVLGALVAGAAMLWQGKPYLGLVVGTAMALNTMVAVSIGGLVPLLLRRLRLDPALASGPILTTVTDMCGFFLVLGIATLMLPRLAG